MILSVKLELSGGDFERVLGKQKMLKTADVVLFLFLRLENQSLNISNLSVGTRVSIYNFLGHCFYQQAATLSELSIQLPSGYYILHINCAQGLHRTILIQ